MWEFLEKKKPLRASKGQFSSERLSEAFPPLVLHLRSSSTLAIFCISSHLPAILRPFWNPPPFQGPPIMTTHRKPICRQDVHEVKQFPRHWDPDCLVQGRIPVEEILAFFVVFLAVFLNSKEKKIRGKKGTEKSSESLGWEGSLCANPLCPPTPFETSEALRENLVSETSVRKGKGT